MEKQKCAGRTYDNISRLFGRCQHNGSLEHDGKMWCKTHHPPTVKSKEEALRAKWAEEARIRSEARRAENINRDLRDKALAWMRETSPDIVAAWEAELEEKWKS